MDAVKSKALLDLPVVHSAYLQATAKLLDALHHTWKTVMPPDSRWPTQKINIFFEPFAELAVSLYDACACASIADFESEAAFTHWLNFDLKRMICDAIAPYNPDALAFRPLEEMPPPGEWLDRMIRSWNTFDHPHHDLSGQKIIRTYINLFDDDGRQWSELIGYLSRAMARQTARCVVEFDQRRVLNPINIEPTLPSPLMPIEQFANVAVKRQPRVGDLSLLEGKDAVPTDDAEEYLGIEKRQRQNLVKRGVLETVGEGHRKKITVQSLLRYQPPQNAQ